MEGRVGRGGNREVMLAVMGEGVCCYCGAVLFDEGGEELESMVEFCFIGHSRCCAAVAASQMSIEKAPLVEGNLTGDFQKCYLVPERQKNVQMANCPTPLASALELTTNYDCARINYSSEEHTTHTSSELNELFANMADASKLEINLDPAITLLANLPPRFHRTQIEEVLCHDVATEGHVSVNAVPLLIAPLLSLLRQSHPTYNFDASPEDVNAMLVESKTGKVVQMKSRIDFAIYATNVNTDERSAILILEIKSPNTLLKQEFEAGEFKKPQPVPTGTRRSKARAVSRLRRTVPSRFQGNALKVLCQARKYLLNYNLNLAFLLDGKSLVGLFIKTDDLEITSSHEEDVRAEYFFENDASKFVLLAFAASLMGLQQSGI